MAASSKESWHARAEELLASQPNLGYRAVHGELKEEGFDVALKKVQKFMSGRSDGMDKCQESAKPEVHEVAMEQCETVGMGIGMLAQQDVAAGALLISEAPVMKTKEENCMEIFKELSQNTRAAVMRLHNDFPAEPAIVGIFRTNSMPCPRSGDTEWEAPRGLFLQVSRINHSCSPNVMQTWSEASGTMQVRAVRPIKKGEEVCLSYLDPSFPWEERQQDFKENFGFQCCCRLCSLPASSQERRTSDRNRAEMKAMRASLANTQDPSAALQIIEKLLSLYEQERLAMPIVVAQLAGHAFNMTASAGRIKEAKRYAELAAENYGRMFGKENDKARKFQEFADRMRR